MSNRRYVAAPRAGFDPDNPGKKTISKHGPPLVSRRERMAEDEMVRLIEAFWHDKGHRKVKAWVGVAGVIHSNLLPGAWAPKE